MTNEQRYYAKDDEYLEVFIEHNKLLLRPSILIQTNYNHININTEDLNNKEAQILEDEIGFNPFDVKVLSFWS